MKTRLLMFVAMVCSMLGAAFAQSPSPDALRVMSFNVRVPVEADGPDYWPNRRDVFVETVRRAHPDVIGTQELKQEQGDYLLAKLPGYSWFGVDRRGGHADEHMGVFYRRDRLTLVELGNYWLSETPDIAGSISWGHPFPRMVTWGLFERKADRSRFYLIDTHFPYRAEDDAARTKAAELIAARIAALPKDVPVVLTGDFNTTSDKPAHAVLTRLLSDARVQASAPSGPEGTFHGFTGKPGDRIDWILTRGVEVERLETDTHHRGARYPSDHFPVIADLAL